MAARLDKTLEDEAFERLDRLEAALHEVRNLRRQSEKASAMTVVVASRP